MFRLRQKKIIQKEVQPMREQYLEELILNVNMPHEDTNVTQFLTTTTIRLRQKKCFVIYRVIIKSFPDYKHVLKENYVE
jgi:hypothetical protein